MPKQHISMNESGHQVVKSIDEPTVLHTSRLSGCLSVAALFDSVEGKKAILLSHYPPSGSAETAERNISHDITLLRSMGLSASVGAILVPGKWVEDNGRWVVKPYDSISEDIVGYEKALGIDAVHRGYVPVDPTVAGMEKDLEWGKGTAQIRYNPNDDISALRVYIQGSPVDLK